MATNFVCVTGNLVADCEKKQAGSVPLASFVIAINELKKNKEGEYEDYPNFIECNLFGNLAKLLSDKLLKGARVAITGKLYQSRWEKDGQNMSKISITVNEIEVIRKPEKKETPVQEEIPW